MSDRPFRVLPALDASNEFFWTSGADGLLRFLRCSSCGHHLHPPGPRCPACGGRELAPAPVSGRGEVVSFTVNHQPWDGDTEPYVIALVELVEQVGLRLTTNIVGCSPDDVTIGMPVRVAFEHRDPVWLPLFEYARILERTANVVGSALRFVEPESGEVVALRSDMTPQVARVISTRMRQSPRPLRLCYQGSVLRRRQERARIESQVIQAGVELVGSGGAQADEEVLEVLAAAVSSTGLRQVVLDLGHAGIAHSLLRNVPVAAQPSLTDALSAKDAVEVERRAKAAQMPARDTRALCSRSCRRPPCLPCWSVSTSRLAMAARPAG